MLQDVWPEVLRCISRFELLSQMAAGGITDMALFAPPAPEPASPSGFSKLRRGLFASGKPAKPEGRLACCRLCAIPCVGCRVRGQRKV